MFHRTRIFAHPSIVALIETKLRDQVVASTIKIPADAVIDLDVDVDDQYPILFNGKPSVYFGNAWEPSSSPRFAYTVAELLEATRLGATRINFPSERPLIFSEWFPIGFGLSARWGQPQPTSSTSIGVANGKGRT